MKVDKFDYKTGKDLILSTISDLDDDGKIDGGGSFNFGFYKKNYNEVEKDIDLLVDELKKKGLDLTQYMKKHENQIFHDFDFNGHSAFMDTLLYWFDKQKGELAGMRLIDSSDIEYVIKYQYGYLNYDMGKKYILQSYPTIEEYYKATAEKLLIGILWPDYDNTLLGNEFNLNRAQAEDLVNKCSIVEKQVKGYGIFVHLRSLFSELSRITKTSYNFEEFVINLKTDLDTIPFKKHGDILEIMIGYNKSKISQSQLEKINKQLELVYSANLYNL